LPYHTFCVHAATLTPPTVRVHLMVHPSAMRAFTVSCQVRLFRIPLTGFREVCLTRQQFSLYVAALTSPRLRLGADRPARLRQSLPQPGSPPARVCYHYSAQPPIAEAGFSPARVS